MSPLLLLWLPLAGASTWLPCPDGQLCPTAPALPASRTGASCPLPGGVTCTGGHRCCPRGSHCSADGDSCVTSLAPRAVPCPDGQSECPDGATCCVTASGAWGCCPMPQASCCADKVHCCPHATLCDLAHGRCLSPAGDHLPLGTTFPAWKRQPSVPVTLRQVLCPDGRSVCPDGSTCCQLPSAQYGCCPLQNAVCCSDGQHCCPQGTTCDLERSTCTSARPRAALPAGGEVRCEDGTRCPEGNTCCRISQRAWGCCPLEEAVCCSDHIHCCPRGSTCNPEGSSCLLGGGGAQPWLRKSPALRRGGDVRCDEQTSCPDGSTCCRLATGDWGCCPLEEAVCCPDHIHCCPRGSTCNPEGSSCLLGGGGAQPWLRKSPALRRGGDVRCDEQTSCPDGSTCCRLATGAWGCCPLEQAVCCRDHQHCCPRGYTCNEATQSCDKLLAPTPLLQAPESLRWAPPPPPAPLRAASPPAGGAVPCAASRSCRAGQKCCRSRAGSWGCCPFAQGSCCLDGRHCCPGGSRCVAGGLGCTLRWDLPDPHRVLL